jgi:hypothetical protein
VECGIDTLVYGLGKWYKSLYITLRPNLYCERGLQGDGTDELRLHPQLAHLPHNARIHQLLKRRCDEKENA